jgi:hypothetical protein
MLFLGNVRYAVRHAFYKKLGPGIFMDFNVNVSFSFYFFYEILGAQRLC